MSDIPPVLGILPGAAVAKYLSNGIQTGVETPPQVALRKAVVPLPSMERRWATAPVRDLLDEAMVRFADRRERADGWLAPRLHATLRMTRGEAAETGLWNFLAMLVAPDYVVWRWRNKSAEMAPTERFSGLHYKQAFARLWWAAELFRDGDDYRPVETACRYQDVLNSTMRLDVIDHRPTAVAIIRVLEAALEADTARPSDLINALSSAVNLAGSTIVFDVRAPDPGGDADATADWIAESASMPAVPWDRLPDGPPDGRVTAAALEALVPLFTRLLSEARLRVRPQRSGTDESKEETVRT